MGTVWILWVLRNKVGIRCHLDSLAHIIVRNEETEEGLFVQVYNMRRGQKQD